MRYVIPTRFKVRTILTQNLSTLRSNILIFFFFSFFLVFEMALEDFVNTRRAKRKGGGVLSSLPIRDKIERFINWRRKASEGERFRERACPRLGGGVITS